jgi:hypothetical protein
MQGVVGRTASQQHAYLLQSSSSRTSSSSSDCGLSQQQAHLTTSSHAWSAQLHSCLSSACFTMLQVGQFDVSKGLPVPHIGWNTLHQARSSDLLAAVAPTDRVYYVHSYRCGGTRNGGGGTRALGLFSEPRPKRFSETRPKRFSETRPKRSSETRPKRLSKTRPKRFLETRPK